MKTRVLITTVLILFGALLLGACQNITPQQAQAIVATYESLPAPQRTAIADKALAYVKSLSADQKAAIQATMTAAEAKLVQAHNQSAGAPVPAPTVVPPAVAPASAAPAAAPAAATGPVNATQQPNGAPVIVNFFASAPSSAERDQGVAYFLNYDISNATQVEIAGFVMDNPATGRWPVWGSDPNAVPNEWSIWAANDVAWVDQWMKINFDTGGSSGFQPVTVNSRNVTLSLRDPDYVDGDAVELRINGQSFGAFVLDGRTISLPIVLVSGQNTIEIVATNLGTVPPVIAALTVSNVTAGSAAQVSRALQQGQSDTLIVTAP